MCRYIGLIWLRHSTNWRLSHWLWFSCRRIWSLLKELIKSCLQISKRFWIWLFIIKLKIISWSTLFRIRFFTAWLLIHKCCKCILSPSKFFWHRCIIISSCWLSRSTFPRRLLTMGKRLLLRYNCNRLINLAFRNVTEVFFRLHYLNNLALGFVLKMRLDHSLTFLKALRRFFGKNWLDYCLSLLIFLNWLWFFQRSCLDYGVSHLRLEFRVRIFRRWGWESIELVCSLLLTLWDTSTRFWLSWSFKSIFSL